MTILDDKAIATKVPSNFKRFTVQDWKIVLQPPTREKPKTLGISYDGPEDAKKVDIVEPKEEPRLVWIATALDP